MFASPLVTSLRAYYTATVRNTAKGNVGNVVGVWTENISWCEPLFSLASVTWVDYVKLMEKLVFADNFLALSLRSAGAF